jgi:hypothetical protein
MKRRASTCVAAVVGALAVPSALATDNYIALNYNWNGICHSTESGQPDAASGFRSMADRALFVDGSTANCFGTGPTVGISGVTYSLNMNPGVLDIIHLGNTIVFTPATAVQNPPAGSPTRWWDGSGNPGLRADHGVQPDWLATLNQTSQTTTLGSPLLLDSLSSIGVLYQVSNGGGNFDMVLGFTDTTSVTVTLTANDWFGPTNPPAGGAGVSSQSRLGNTTFTGTNGTDNGTQVAFPTQSLAVTEAVVTVGSINTAGLGNIAGKQLSSITFQNPTQPLRGYAIFAATVVTGLGPPSNDDCANAMIVLAGTTSTSNLRATGATTSPCGTSDTTDVWYRFIAPSSGLVEARTCGAQFDTTIAVYGSCGGAAIACNDNACGLASRVQWNAIFNTAYWIRVAGNGGSTGNFDLTIDTAAVSHNDLPIPLNYNWNGMVHTGENGQPDAANGFRSISDRAFYATGTMGSVNAGTPSGTDFIPYTLVSAAGQLDIVHLGNTGPGSPRDWDPAPNGDARGTVPTWLTNLDQSTPQRTNLAPLNKGMGPDTTIGVLFNICNGGGFFDCILEFADNTTASVQLAAPDWYLDQTPPPPGSGVLVQRELGTFSATQNQDLATLGAPAINVVEAVFSTSSLLNGGMGDVNGKRLSGLTFANLTPNTVGAEVFAVTFRDAVPNFSSTSPVGVGNSNPSPAEQTRNVLLTVAVSPGLNPTSTGLVVTADLSALGGSSTQQFYDDHTHGDATAGDLTFSYLVTLSSSQSTGQFLLPFTVTDAQARSGSGNIPVTVVAYAWNEILDGGSDAGELLASAQHISGSGTLNGIRGTLTGAETDMYALFICDHANFSASTVGGSSLDTQLFLFDPTGHGVTFDDDTGSAQSTVTGQFLTSDGLYYLAISEYNRDAHDAANNLIWNDAPFAVERQPDGPGAANTLAQWDNGGGGGGGYLITLTGVCRGEPPPRCGSADFNCDGDTGTDADIESFFACLAGNCPPPPCPNNADFNADGDTGTDADIESFFRVLAGGPC